MPPSSGIGDVLPPEGTRSPQDPFKPALLMERVLRALLQTTVEDWQADLDEARRYFTWFFESTAQGQKELDSFIGSFRKSPPRAQLGYARAGASLPIWAIVLSDEEETEAFMGDYIGQDGEMEDYEGAFFEAVYTVFTYAEHPDMAQIYYQLSKSIVTAGKGFLLSCGALEVSLSGGELAPDENYMPENMFVRALRVRMKHPFSAPRVKPADPARLRTFIYASDVVVEGLRGGVKVYDGTEEEETP